MQHWSLYETCSELSAYFVLSVSVCAVQVVQGEETHRWHQGHPSPGHPWRSHHPLPWPPDQGQRHRPHWPVHRQNHRLHQVWHWWGVLFRFWLKADYRATCNTSFVGRELADQIQLSSIKQVTCAWSLVVLTWGVLEWSPTGRDTLDLSTSCTSRTPVAPPLPLGCPTSLWLARWEMTKNLLMCKWGWNYDCFVEALDVC